MKKKTCHLLLPLMCLLFLFDLDLKVKASVIDEASKSKINILIKEKTLYLENVSVPKFEDEKLIGKKQVIHPINDFKFTVKDHRGHSRNSWQIHYSLSLFSNETNEQVDDQLLVIGKGKVEQIDDNSYESYKITTGDNNYYPMLKVLNPSKTTYDYIVSKEDFSLNIGEKTKPGDYKAKQTLLLMSLPVSN